MKRTDRRSRNIDDRRGTRMRRSAMGGGIGTIVILLLALFFGFNPMTFLNLGGGGKQVPVESSPIDDDKKAFVSQVLAETETVWTELFEKSGRRYQQPQMVLFSGSTPSACGYAQAAMGPFYCPGDQKVYIDFSFYDELQRKFGAKGDFAQAYVVSHEIGHHVQTLLGLSDQINRLKARSGKSEANELSVMFELQADCLAGVWSHNTHKTFGTLEQGDIEEAVRAAAAIGDDAIQKKTQGYVIPDSFTHGSGEQRAEWFMEGLKSGDMNACNTFNG